MTYTITFEENPADAEIEILAGGIDRFTESMFSGRTSRHLTFFLRDEEGAIAGGVHGKCGSFGWLYVAALWISEEVRGGGYGVRLMNDIEQAAIEYGCRNAYLDTFSFQAPEFYKRLGYEIFGELEDFPAGHSRIFLRKRLI